MCWLGEIYSEKLIAEKDIEVYKVGFKTGFFFWRSFESLYHNFVYKRNVRTPKIDLKPESYYYSEGEQTLEIDEGYHSYESFSLAYLKCLRASAIGKFIIPKGTGYYINSSGDIVSETLIFKGFCNGRKKRTNR